MAIGTCVVYFARAQDDQQILTEQQIVSSAIRDAMIKLGDALLPNTYWDDAYDQVTDKVDGNWSKKNLGPYARDTSGVSVLLVISESGKVIYRSIGDEPRKLASEYDTNAAVLALVRQAQVKTTAPPYLATGFVRVGGIIYLAAASQIVPNDDRAKMPLSHHNVEVYLQEFGAARISKVQRDFRLAPVSVSIDPPPNDVASVILRDAANHSIGYLWWHPATPGKTLAAAISPFALSTVALIGLLLWLVLRNWALTLANLEKQRAEAETLRQESQAKSVFIGNISHELRTPLNAILGFSDIFIKQTFGPLGSPNYCEYAEHIHSNGDILLHRINDVIELSSIEAHEKPLTVELTDANFLAEEALSTMQQTANEKDVRLTLSRGSEARLVNTSVAATHEILTRLLDNAIKFSHHGDRVEVFVDRDDATIIRVCDHGKGIEPMVIESLGRPFVQIEDHLRRTNGGLGLGLAICFGLAKALDIEISIESDLGQGTTATLRIPSVQAGEAEFRHAA